MMRHIVSAQANIGAADVKPRSGGRSQNYMPIEAAYVCDRAAKPQKTLQQ
jgi:hypothetical protein